MILALITLLAVAQTDETVTPPVPGTEQAEEAKSRAGALVNEGNALFDRAQYRAALSKYESAYRVYPSPKILFNIAEAHAQLGHAHEAATYYDRFLVEAKIDPTSDIAAKVREKRSALDPNLAFLEIEGEPTGAEISIDEKVVGSLPLQPPHVAPGKHEVTATMPGYQDQKYSVEAVAGERTRVEIKLPLLAAVKPEEPAAVLTTTTPEKEEPLTSKWYFWTAIGGAVAAGVIVAVAASSGGDPFALGGDVAQTSTKDWTQSPR